MSKKISAPKEYESKLKKLKLLKEKEEIEQGLPHLHGQKFYKWSREFFESRNRYTFLCSGNQVGKSSIQIRKVIHWATEPKLWPQLWNGTPLSFWYLYPIKEVATIEFEKKWIASYLPRGRFKDDPQYGWTAEYKNRFIWALHFKTGVSVYFKTYATDVQNLQTGTVYYIACDEELPEELFDELNMRISATDGYFSKVFTATLGQEFWRQTIESKGRSERFKGAVKIQVSMYDCLFFEDGTPSHWTKEKILRIENSCKSKTEVQKRVYGKFVKDDGLKYSGFDRDRNVKEPHPLPSTWNIYAGVDVGSGGEKGHPAAIVFVAVAPDFKSGRVFKGWRGDGVLTTASDVVTKYIEMKEGLIMTAQYYDWAAKDFQTIAHRMGEPFLPAEKGHELGEQVLNVLFKNEMLMVYDVRELHPLIDELCSLGVTEKKTKAKDDYIDALRYAVTRIPWDWKAIKGEQIIEKKKPMSNEEMGRRGLTFEGDNDLSIMINEEIDSWNELYDV